MNKTCEHEWVVVMPELKYVKWSEAANYPWPKSKVVCKKCKQPQEKKNEVNR